MKKRLNAETQAFIDFFRSQGVKFVDVETGDVIGEEECK